VRRISTTVTVILTTVLLAGSVSWSSPAGSTPVAGRVRPLLLDLDGTHYRWDEVAPRYGVIVLNAWNSSWIPAIRAANPDVRVYEYKDLTSTRPSACAQSARGAINSGLPTGVDFCWARAHHPGWFLRRANGRLLRERGFPGQYEMDYGNPAYQRQWAANVVQDLTAHGWDGVEIDNALVTHDAYGVSPRYPTDAATQEATGRMLAIVGPAIKAAGKRAVANIGWDTRYPDVWARWLPLLTGAMDEYTWSWSTSIDRNRGDWRIFRAEVRACSAARRQCFFHVGDYERQPAGTVTFALASYLLFADGRSAFGPGDMWWRRYPATRIDLGGAVTRAHINRSGNWQRDFRGGSVIVDLSHWSAQIRVR
jgi:Hypothetical glycosyl hydrolase family 15